MVTFFLYIVNFSGRSTARDASRHIAATSGHVANRVEIGIGALALLLIEARSRIRTPTKRKHSGLKHLSG